MPSAEDPARSRAEQPDAVRAYHEALAALDDALRQLAATPYAGNFQAPEPEAPRGWRQRLSAFAWRRVPLLRQQRAFNAVLVDTLTQFVRQITAVRRHPRPRVVGLAQDASAALAKDEFSAGLGQDASAARGKLAQDLAERDASADKLAQARRRCLRRTRQARTGPG